MIISTQDLFIFQAMKIHRIIEFENRVQHNLKVHSYIRPISTTDGVLTKRDVLSWRNTYRWLVGPERLERTLGSGSASFQRKYNLPVVICWRVNEAEKHDHPCEQCEIFRSSCKIIFPVLRSEFTPAKNSIIEYTKLTPSSVVESRSVMKFGVSR